MIKVHLSRLLGEHKKRVADLQRETGLARNTLSGLYFETSTRVDFDTINALCRYFNCQVADLLEFVPDTSKRR